MAKMTATLHSDLPTVAVVNKAGPCNGVAAQVMRSHGPIEEAELGDARSMYFILNFSPGSDF